MPLESDIPDIVRAVKAMTGGDGDDGIAKLRLAGYRFSDGWLYLVVEPARPGGRASDHARSMTHIERQLRQAGYDDVLLVPSVPEHTGLVDVPEPA